jgi:hypothetical protein
MLEKKYINIKIYNITPVTRIEKIHAMVGTKIKQMAIFP